MLKSKISFLQPKVNWVITVILRRKSERIKDESGSPGAAAYELGMAIPALRFCALQ